ncbi:MAG: aminoacyl--tRNA ligase-related protein [Candidatus Saccharimonadia bacterium]
MKLSQTFVRTDKNYSGEGEAANHRLLVKAGFVRQEAAGIYSYLPLGLRVLRNIEAIVRIGMNNLGAEEILMPVLHPAAPWKTTGGWDSIDVLYKLKSRTGQEYALGQSEEEIVTPLVMGIVSSYKDLPRIVYQIHWKYRDELRAKSGILRGREFFMKDMYSFHASQEDFDSFYKRAKDAYIDIYGELGLTAKVTEASGGNFSEKISYEFEVLTDAGEDVIYYCENCDFCVEDEVAKVKPGDLCPRCAKAKLKSAKAAEVGNVFDLGQKYGKDFDLGYVDQKDEKHYPIMGCYGIGISRVMGVIVEKYHDEAGIIWPESVAPAKVHIISIGGEKSAAAAGIVYEKLTKQGIECIFDDRDNVTAGEKFADFDLIGCPYRVTISQKTLAQDGAEIKRRTSSATEIIPLSQLVKSFT